MNMPKEIPAATMRELRGVLIRWALLLALLTLAAGLATWRLATTTPRAPVAAAHGDDEPAIEYWTCTMHPEVQLPQAGACPICGMTLVARYAGAAEPPPSATSASGQAAAPTWYRCTMPGCGDQGSADPESHCPVCGMQREPILAESADVGPLEIELSERARRLAEIASEPALERMLFKRIRTVGRVSYDETRTRMVSAWTGGRIDKLFADYTGMTVSRGDHLVSIYSPELLSAQEEFLQAVRASSAAAGLRTEIARRSSGQLLDAARRKLDLFGITPGQVEAIERSGAPQTHLVIHAPLGGTILAKQAMEGMYVKTGDPLYTIADLRHLWLLVDLYEGDLPWIKPFQRVRVTTRSLPGEVFDGEIFFVDPSVDPQTRTVEVRIHVDNPDLRLKPDMWVAAEVDADLGPQGEGTVPTPAGSHACPMHPWETADGPGTCQVCAMQRVPVESLPTYAAPTAPAALLSVPRTAVLQTGVRALVYVETAEGRYRAVDVTPGPLARGADQREYYPILAGLSAGQRVVTRGNFAIDSQMQLSGRPSLFDPRTETTPTAPPERDESDSATGRVTSPGSEAGDDDGQPRCPVMGGAIDPEVFTDYRGVRIYFCCPPCIDTFEGDPDQYLPALPAAIRERIAAADREERDRD